MAQVEIITANLKCEDNTTVANKKKEFVLMVELVQMMKNN